MRVLALLLSPRGAIGPRAFGLGLLSLAMLEVVLFVVLASLDLSPPALLPAIGPWFIAFDGPMLGAQGWLLNLAVIALQAWISGVLCLKRLRDAGRGPAPLVNVWLANLALGGCALLKIVEVERSNTDSLGMLVFAITLLGAGAAGLIWIVFLMWLGPARRPAPPASTHVPAG
ncbi:hypothetical protein [Caulobacter hibisci]|uniref:DUF2231 domain-containing protein n=1 Tax=Caulobacter hibisci TaxID=2035993 RepID=A0ABS0T418_9CAUL|nr:hypothetical protein [Caulobacter hibisci]MBI1685830.1 hypothetical protein [Caulobacter hibisci]